MGSEPKCWNLIIHILKSLEQSCHMFGSRHKTPSQTILRNNLEINTCQEIFPRGSLDGAVCL